MKFLISALGVALYVIILMILYNVHISFFKIDVVFYSSIFASLLAIVIFLPIIAFIPIFGNLNSLEKAQLIIINILVGYSMAISLPTVIDRSLSFYILEKLDQRGGAIKQDAFKDVFTKEYIYEHRLVDVRLTEQVESGTIEIEEGCVYLTEKGRSLVKFSRYFRKNWLPKERLLMGEYTDALINPLKSDTQKYDYLCYPPRGGGSRDPRLDIK